MKLGLAAFAVALVLAVLLSGSSTADLPPPGLPQYGNKMLSDFSTPTVSPGRTVDFKLNISNTYEVSRDMTDIHFTVGIYRYATQETVKDVDSNFSHPPLIAGNATEKTFAIPDLHHSASFRLEFEIETSDDTPHGSYFSQATYFVRTKISFHFMGNATTVLLQSRGWFTQEQWQDAVWFKSGNEIVNRSYLNSIGVDGLIPDSSFGLRQPIPVWPLGLVVFACMGSAFMAVYYFVLDNPGRYPRLEKRFYYLRGKLSELRGKFKDRR